MAVDISLLTKYGTYEEELMGAMNNITAFAGGGQGNATLLTKKWNNVSIVANDYDSVKLPVGAVGKKCVVTNGTGKVVSVYVSTNDYINGVLNSYVIVPIGSSVVFECVNGGVVTGDWISYELGQNSTDILTFKQSLSSADILTLFSNPKILVPAIPNYYIEFISGSLAYTNVINYTAGGSIQIIMDTGSIQIATLSQNFSFGSSFHLGFFKPNSGDIIINKALTLKVSGSNPTTGTGTAIVYGCYRIHKI